ncbi:hypothetical protein [Chitinophaga oryzae]|uniref:hypothetical protein n=1 Tax=Chitinophaga oryzae TaxID=2725414 RepID=UPI003CCD98A8
MNAFVSIPHSPIKTFNAIIESFKVIGFQFRHSPIKTISYGKLSLELVPFQFRHSPIKTGIAEDLSVMLKAFQFRHSPIKTPSPADAIASTASFQFRHSPIKTRYNFQPASHPSSTSKHQSSIFLKQKSSISNKGIYPGDRRLINKNQHQSYG